MKRIAHSSEQYATAAIATHSPVLDDNHGIDETRDGKFYPWYRKGGTSHYYTQGGDRVSFTSLDAATKYIYRSIGLPMYQ